jgi:hypothetical protein
VAGAADRARCDSTAEKDMVIGFPRTPSLARAPLGPAPRRGPGTGFIMAPRGRLAHPPNGRPRRPPIAPRPVSRHAGMMTAPPDTGPGPARASA